MFSYCSSSPVSRCDPTGFEYEEILEDMFASMDKKYPYMDATKSGIHKLTEKMSSEEFSIHLWRAYTDCKWKYTYGHAQYRNTDCVGLYKAIMEWYYTKVSFKDITRITQGKNKGKSFNQVKDLIRYGLIDGEEGLQAICACCDLPPVGAAVFCYSSEEDGNSSFNKNQGWTHVGYYVGNGIVIEAESRKTGIVASSIFDSKWDCWGYLKGIDYGES